MAASDCSSLLKCLSKFPSEVHTFELTPALPAAHTSAAAPTATATQRLMAVLSISPGKTNSSGQRLATIFWTALLY